MTRVTPALTLALALFGTASAVCAQVLPRGYDQISSEGKTLTHPRELRIETPPLGGYIGRGITLCAYYGTTKKRQKGEISVRAELHRGGTVLESVEFSGRIKKAERQDGDFLREFLRCSKPTCPEDPRAQCETDEDLELETVPEPGDVFVFHLSFDGLRQLKPRDRAEVTVGPYPRSSS